MGSSKYNLDFQRKVYDGFALIVPAGTWHNVINTGDKPLKLYTIYAPPQYSLGTVHATKQLQKLLNRITVTNIKRNRKKSL